MKKEEIEPAFPSGKIDVGSEWADWPHRGMTLRDYFAAQALAVIPGDNAEPAELARDAYRIADAMLAERAAQEG